MSRSFLRGVVLDTDGEPIVGATIRLFELGTTTPLPEPLYANSTSLTPISSVQLTNALGEYEYWVDGLGRHCTVQASGAAIPTPQRESGAFVADGRDVPDQADLTALQIQVDVVEAENDALTSDVADLTDTSNGLVADVTTLEAAVGYLQTFHNVKFHGAIGDGAVHPLSTRFATLAAAQAVYPHATALTNQLDWAAAQGAVAAAEAQTGGTVYWPPGAYLHDQELRIRKGVMLQGVFSDSDTNGAGSGAEATRIRWAGVDNGRMVRFEGPSASHWVVGGGIDQLLLDGQGTAGAVAATAVQLRATQHVRIGRLKIRNIRVQGLVLDDQPFCQSFSNIIEDLDVTHGFANPGGIGDNACGLVLHGSSMVLTGGVTQNHIKRVRASHYNGDAVRLGFADNNLIEKIQAIPVRGADLIFGTGYAVQFQTTTGVPADPTYGFPAGNVIEMVNGNIFAQGFSHGNVIRHHTSEGARITMGPSTHLHYEAYDFQSQMLHQTHRYTMTDVYPIAATALQPGAGVTTGEIAGLWGGWSLPDSAVGKVMGSAHPYAWGTGTVTACRVHFTMGTPNVGKAIRLRFNAVTSGPGSTVTLEVSSIETVPLNGAVAVHESVDLECVLPYTRGDLISFLLQREPLDALDTASGVVHLLGVDLIYASAGPVNTGGVGPYTPGAPPYSPIATGSP